MRSQRLLVVVGLALLAGLTPTSVAAQIPVSIFNSGAPPPVADPDPGAVELGVRFRADVNGFILGLRFYKNATNGGTHIGSLWTSGGALLATATFTAEAPSGWQMVTFATPVAITANTTYVASYHTNVGHYGATSNYFAAGGVINSPLRALQDGVDGPNGVYRYGATSGFPSDTYQSTNYWIDVLFSTSVATQTTPVRVSSHIPATDATGVNPAAPITADFSAMMNFSSVNPTTFTLRDPAGNLVPAEAHAGGETPTSTLTPLSPLTSGTRYTVTITGGPAGVKDEAGNYMTADFSWSFTTSGTPPLPATCPCTIWNASATPGSGPDSDSSAVEIGLRFRSDVSGFISAVRFYKFATNTGTHTGSLWSNAGVRLATVTFNNESASGWQQVTFGTPIAIAANTTYVASYHTNVGHYAGTGGYFAAAGFDNAPLHALEDGVDGPSGVYHYGSSSAFPTDTYQSANYWVDVVFSTSVAGDITPPFVNSVTPATGASGVSISTVVTATFSEMINASSLNASTFLLRDAAGNLVPATAYAGGETPTATLVPTSALAYLTTYTATVIGGASGVKDLAGNPLVGNTTWSFTTGASTPPPPPTCPCTIWNASTTPGGADADPNAVELGLRFRSDVAGFITGIRFYQFPTNKGTHSGSLWSNTGTLLSTANFTTESGSGWQQVTFSLPVAITAGTTYVASYHTNVGHYAANTNYFVAGVENAPLHALADGIDGPSGVYLYGATSGFPNQTYFATNYWVDVAFSAKPSAEPPNIAMVMPASGTVGVSPTTYVTATFTTFMDPATISAATVQLRTSSGALVPSTVSYSVVNGTAILVPTLPLAAGTTYTATVVGGTVDPRVKNVGGMALAATLSWSFTTAP